MLGLIGIVFGLVFDFFTRLLFGFLLDVRVLFIFLALTISRIARRIIKQNLAISLGSVIIMAIASLFGIVPLTLGVLTHEGSTVVVCLNSLRLLFEKE